MLNSVLAALKYKDFIFNSIKRDFKSRYQTSMLGAVWLVLQPLSMIIVYTVIFSEVMKARMPNSSGSFAYSIYLCAGLLTWGFFSELLSRLINVFVDNGNYLKKINFPRICLPIISIGVAFLNFLIIFSLYIIFLIVTGNFPGIAFLYIIPLLVIQIVFALGLGMTLGVLNVFFRDVGQLMGILLQFWFWFTPVIYLITIIPEWARKWLYLNPMTGLITGYQNIFVYHKAPDWSNLILVSILAIIFSVIGYYLYHKHSGEIVDEL
ncbi:transport permease protein [Klebsiella sp. WP7-S18-CRE-02]|uniref:ABC transporter permease n=1 Tax=Enterobacteriaceae TaxID=543 RepID=UPI0015DC6265|nr:MULTISPECIES: ABC transporter permease [unclassified Klebsiella]HAT3952074.1 ABC transporter permease [Kluyvera ascorbata]BBR59519.1 transport permease protein [Klebsiella sp. WP4-W18-ESBL-05]BBS91145.1 transport permease protein [Klebsiella sp. WP7-S18-CRE-02]BBS96168.1 transport permease protein [Klebsiella sp. WP7-S18-CRE-03]BBT01198.1 transport permease protein [Klebsiella sp. WP7-S18-ESBL-04]